jgi:type VI protein secretion system component VasK
LERLGQEWARTDHGVGAAAGLFTHELFREVIVGDESLAVPDSRLGPIGRRAVLGAGGVVSFCAVAIWVASFAQNYLGSQELIARASVAQSRDPSVPELNALRESIEAQQVQSANLINWLGFNLLGDAEERARRSYVDAFRRNFDRATKDKLEHSLGDRRGDTAVKAAVVIASDLDFLSSAGTSDAPDLADYLPNRAPDAGSYIDAYASYARWLSEEARQQEVRTQKDLIGQAAPRLLQLNALEEQTVAPGASFPPVRYEDFGLTPPDGARGTVPGIYTKAGFDGLVTTLLGAVDEIDALPEEQVRSFRRRYVDYYDRRWRDFLTDVPTPPVADRRVLESPYVALVKTLGDNAGVELPRDRDDPVPLWVEALGEVLRRIPMTREELSEDGKRPPWTQYVERLEAVEKQVSAAIDDPVEALQQARDAAEGRETDYALALETVKQIVPSRGSREEERKLVEILEQPVLDSFSAVLESARTELDRRWRKEISGEYGQQLRAVDFRQLYDQGGQLDKFREAELAAYYDDGQPVALLGGRTLPFGPEFLRWMARAEQLQETVQTRGFSSDVPVRLRALPPGVPGRSDVQVLRQTLRMKCPGRDDATLRYRSGGYGVETFSWTSECDLITLELAIGGEGAREEGFERTWSGPLAFPEFFATGEPRNDAGLRYLEWSLVSPGGVNVLVRFELQSGSEIMDIAHQRPPSSVGS